MNTVFQSYALFPHLTVFDNVAFGLRRKGTDKSEVSSLVEEHLDLLGLGGFGSRPARNSPAVNSSVSLWLERS